VRGNSAAVLSEPPGALRPCGNLSPGPQGDAGALDHWLREIGMPAQTVEGDAAVLLAESLHDLARGHQVTEVLAKPHDMKNLITPPVQRTAIVAPRRLLVAHAGRDETPANPLRGEADQACRARVRPPLNGAQRDTGQLRRAGRSVQLGELERFSSLFGVTTRLRARPPRILRGTLRAPSDELLRSVAGGE
jgi:hypothetical protein